MSGTSKRFAHNTRATENETGLLLYTDRSGMPSLIPVGALMGIMSSNKERDPKHRILLIEAKPDRLAFRCICNPTCKMVYVLRIEEKGHHGG